MDWQHVASPTATVSSDAYTALDMLLYWFLVALMVITHARSQWCKLCSSMYSYIIIAIQAGSNRSSDSNTEVELAGCGDIENALTLKSLESHLD